MNTIMDVIVFTHPLVQNAYEYFLENKLQRMGFKDYQDVFKPRKGVGEKLFEKWRREFIRKELLSVRMIRFDRSILLKRTG